MAKGGKQGGRGNANKFGGNSHREDKDYLAYKAAKAKKEKKKDREASAKAVVKLLDKKQECLSRPKDLKPERWLSDSDDTSSNDSSDDERKVSKSKYKRCKKAAESFADKAAALETEVTSLRTQVTSHEKLMTAVTTTLSPPKDGGKASSRSVTMDRQAWDELQVRLAPKPASAKGIFDDFFEDDQVAVSAKDVIVALGELVQKQEELVSFNGQAGRVSEGADKQIRCVADEVIVAHPVMNDKGSEEFKTLMDLKSKYIGCNGSKNANTIVAAILRTLTSRKVSVSKEVLGLS